jgi:hypothetical protein
LRCGEEAGKSCVRQTFLSVDSTSVISSEALMPVPGLAAALQNKPLLARVFSPDSLDISRTCVARQPKLSFRLARIMSSRSERSYSLQIPFIELSLTFWLVISL